MPVRASSLIAALASLTNHFGDIDPTGAQPLTDFFLRLGRPNGQIESRSEEHTSELQSLMRISYAVFCLKKKKKQRKYKHINMLHDKNSVNVITPTIMTNSNNKT